MPASRPRKAGTGRLKAESSPAPIPSANSKASRFLIVGIGASAGGLDACRQFLHALPADVGMSFILVQHLDHAHESMLVELLASHTTMNVVQAETGMRVSPDHLYVIPSGYYLAVEEGEIQLSQPPLRHGARLPFDYLLESIAGAYGKRAACIILSGIEADGRIGLKAIKRNRGLVLVQDSTEATYDGMPRNAVDTNLVDSILFIDKMPAALIHFSKGLSEQASGPYLPVSAGKDNGLAAIIDLLREKTTHDFRLYKRGTLQRWIERRILIASDETRDMHQYLEVLRKNHGEIELLTKDLLTNVKRFFNHADVFDVLAADTIPGIIRAHNSNQPLRIWVPSCSTGEEAYSLAILFREAIISAKSDVRLQIFASDVDPDAIATAGEGLYPATITAEVSEERLNRFFSKDEHGYHILPELRAAVIFTVQDVLTEPPFSRIDMVSCQNLLIYLDTDIQAKVIALFHFVLRANGILLLGPSETIGHIEGRFEVISKPERLYRRISHGHPRELNLLHGTSGDAPIRSPNGKTQSFLRQAALAELCRRTVIETFAPATVLINLKNECVYHLGPTAQYLKVAKGRPGYDLLSMASPGLRTKLRSAIQMAIQTPGQIAVGRCRSDQGANTRTFGLNVQKVVNAGEDFLLVSFIDEPDTSAVGHSSATKEDISRIMQLEQELEATRNELLGAIHDLKASGEEQRSINEEAHSVNEECQATYEELLTTKEELQSRNKELTALNNQLQEKVEQQHTTANDLQNVLYSTDLATIFLDTDLKIRFYTPAIKSLFNVIPGDIGRPLADLNSLADDSGLLSDARAVLQKLVPSECEIESLRGVCFVRRILPYRTHDNGVEGVVITFTDVSDQKHTAHALEAARRVAELATAAKSRFLAAASHDLRQPLQTLKLLQGLLLEIIEGVQPRKLIMRIDETVGAMSGMLNALLDINQIETGEVQAHPVRFRISDLLDRLRDEFNYHANAQGLMLRMIPCHLMIKSDVRLLEQMLRNLLSNALKYTKQGRILLGCRRHDGLLSIQIWDTGSGIPEEQLQAIFEEFHQLENPARERTRGQGLGLSIVQRLGGLLGHQIRVRSTLGKGSMFSIDVALAPLENSKMSELQKGASASSDIALTKHVGMILLVEDEPDLRELLGSFLTSQGHQVAAVVDGIAALDWITHCGVQPDLILTDHNLPRGLTGLQLVVRLRQKLGREIPAIVLTGDISNQTARDVALERCTQLNKPAKLKQVTYVIQRLLAQPALASTDAPLHANEESVVGARTDKVASPIVFVVDDDNILRETIRMVLESAGRKVKDFHSCEAFLKEYLPSCESCLLVDANLPGMKGLELLQKLRALGDCMPTIMITGSNDIAIAVEAMKAGATDFIAKPFERSDMLDSVTRALELSRDANKLKAWKQEASDQIADLTPRQRQIMDMVLAGHPSKNIASDLGISQRTVENHRAEIMKRTESKSIPALARLALAATLD